MNKSLRAKASDLIEELAQIPGVHACSIYGSLLDGREDHLSDIDIEIDVSGMDNGEFALRLPEIMRRRMPIVYSDYAPSLAPDQYVVSLALDQMNPFLIADIRCFAQPHCDTVSREELQLRNHPYSHMLKLWTANLKHYARKGDCRGDILRMAQKAKINDPESKTDAELLADVLRWLEANAPSELQLSVRSCREAYERLTAE